MEIQGQEKSKKNSSEIIEKDSSKGLNDWNDRLDENLEPEDRNDTTADIKSKEYSEKFDGKADQ
ncbi:hypothetical protein OQZ33_16580 [Pedobacter sp. MC2016-05]|uniref:hypothetical protein n=1 Tax=Pedobacter sp. MC2016-05 TaxID=2994474 RepID=UPI002246A665|nr:hypothetical protein [Pedobacter sp. MC2016-05]MCX2475950.1 hypothetical protein [Pedobacter sp. MC2016-05]